MVPSKAEKRCHKYWNEHVDSTIMVVFYFHHLPFPSSVTPTHTTYSLGHFVQRRKGEKRSGSTSSIFNKTELKKHNLCHWSEKCVGGSSETVEEKCPLQWILPGGAWSKHLFVHQWHTIGQARKSWIDGGTRWTSSSLTSQSPHQRAWVSVWTWHRHYYFVCSLWLLVAPLLGVWLCRWCSAPFPVSWYSFFQHRKDDRLTQPTWCDLTARQARTQDPKILNQPATKGLHRHCLMVT